MQQDNSSRLFNDPSLLAVFAIVLVLVLVKMKGAKLDSHIMLVVFALIFAFIVIFALKKWLTPPPTSHGSANWLSSFKQSRIINKKNTGYVIADQNRITHDLSTKNIITIAPTGAGKTWSQVIPNIFYQDQYSIAVTDPSGEVYKNTAAAAQKAGVNILLFQPFAPDKTQFYNPLQHVETITQAKVVAEAIMQQLDGPGSDKFWTLAPGMLISSIISLLKDMSDKTQVNQKNMSNLLKMLHLPFEELSQLVKDIGTESTQLEYTGYREAGEKTRPGILASAMTALSLFTDENIKKSTQHTSINFSELRDKKSILYLVVPEDKMTYAKSLLALMYKELFGYLFSNTSGLPVYLLLDEFGNMKIPAFETIVTQSRKKNISISLMLQSIEQLKDKYGSAATTIAEGGCQTKIFYSGLGLQTSKMVSESIGNKTEVIFNAEKNLEHRVQRPLIAPDEIRTMPKDQIIVLTGNQLPMKFQIKPAYESEEIKKVLRQFASEEAVISQNNIVMSALL